jgi:hypothetical protein
MTGCKYAGKINSRVSVRASHARSIRCGENVERSHTRKQHLSLHFLRLAAWGQLCQSALCASRYIFLLHHGCTTWALNYSSTPQTSRCGHECKRMPDGWVAAHEMHSWHATSVRQDFSSVTAFARKLSMVLSTGESPRKVLRAPERMAALTSTSESL